MAESRRDSTRAQKEAEKATKGVVEEAEKATEGVVEEAKTATERGAKEAEAATERGVREMEKAAEGVVEALRQQTERVGEIGREGARQASKTSAAAFHGATRTGLALADATEEIAGAWARYGEDVMRNTSEASRALLRSRTMSEMMQAQVAFVHDNMQSFLDHSARLTETASRIVTRPLEVLREVSAEQSP
jgi:transposase